MRFQNELVLFLSVILFDGTLVALYRFLGKAGIHAWTVISSIASNIEVLILIKAFGMETTLGNVLFATSFLATDILSEVYSKTEANKCVKIGIISSLIFIGISSMWSLYIPSAQDTMAGPIHTVFSRTPRIMLSSLVTYAACQMFDVWLYHVLWSKTEKITGDSQKGLWIRNNVATLLSQLLNTVMFNILAFAGILPKATIVQIIVFSYIFFVATSLLDTPFLYLARKISKDVKEI